ncbi:MAG: autotransporter-associated beta strand repeat-containing protein [Verrucomicrobiales bacterium]|jgi:autotransporter-associated beta strand protein|nr:autotransporter-associated beta strand repeat-containing protein [Verrucomicrobiales bacterium]
MNIQITIKRAALLLTVSGMAVFNASADNYWWNPDDITGSGTWDSGTTAAWSPDLAGGARQTITTIISDTITFSATNVPVGTVNIVSSQTAAYLDIKTGNNGINFTGANIYLNERLMVGSSATFNNYVDTQRLTFNATNLTVTFNGGGQIRSGNNDGSGNTATAKIVFTGGTFNVTNNGWRLDYGNPDNPLTGAGVFIKSGATLNIAGLTYVGWDTAGLVTVDGGLLQQSASNNELRIGASKTGRVILNSGTILSSGTGIGHGLNVGGGNKGDLEVYGGLLRATRLNLNGNTGNFNATYLQDGGVAEINTLTLGYARGVTATSGTALVDLRGGALKLGAGGIVNSGSVGTEYSYAVSLGGGTLGSTAAWSTSVDLLLSNFYGGVTFDTGGGDITLSGVLSGFGVFTKTGGGTLLLSGTNTYNGDAVVSAGTLQVDGVLTLGTLTLTLDGADNSALTGGGSVTLGALNIDTSTSAGGSVWQLIDLTGGLRLSAFTVSGYTETSAGSGVWSNGAFEFDLGTGYLSVIPEPSTWALLVTGVALIILSACLRRAFFHRRLNQGKLSRN